jgi:integrase
MGKLKTAASARLIGLDPNLAEAPSNLRENSPFNKSEDWVFANPESAGEPPYWPDSVLTRRLQPTARRLEIKTAIRWHTFRRSYASLLLSSGADVKVCQESLHHANVRITLGLFAKSSAEDTRTAQSKVVQVILPQSAQPLAKSG